MVINQLTEDIIFCAIKVHQSLGPGLLESAYKECLFYELKKKDFRLAKEQPLPLIYEDVKLDCGYRLDIVVESKVIVEIKAIEALHDIHLAQMITYLKLSNIPVGLLINFNVKLLKSGIKRVVI